MLVDLLFYINTLCRIWANEELNILQNTCKYTKMQAKTNVHHFRSHTMWLCRQQCNDTLTRKWKTGECQILQQQKKKRDLILFLINRKGRTWMQRNEWDGKCSLAHISFHNSGLLRCGQLPNINQTVEITKLLGILWIYNIPFIQNWNVRIAFFEYIFFASGLDVAVGKKTKKKNEEEKLRVWWMCSGQRRVGGLHLSALLLQQTAELQAKTPRYHRRHQQQIILQQLSAIHVTLTAAKHTLAHRALHISVCC